MVWIGWLALIVSVTLSAVDLPFAIRMALCVFIATPGIRTVHSFVMLSGARGVRVIEWTSSTMTITVGPERRRVAAILRGESFRVGRNWLSLTFETPGGRRQVLVDGRYQDARAFRRLCREVSRSLKGGAGRDSRTS